nr:unnamed protein product [Callosobruchus analis]
MLRAFDGVSSRGFALNGRDRIPAPKKCEVTTAVKVIELFINIQRAPRSGCSRL